MKEKVSQKSISDFLNKELRDYAIHTIEQRAIPSAIDGFKPTPRKVIFVSNEIWKNINEKTKKVFQLVGSCAERAYYHQGPKSMEDAIITMAQTFKNNLPLFEQDGQFGSLRAPEPGAARYISVKLNENFRKLYKDFELLINKEEEGHIIEPYYYLPIIPMVLINGSSGIASGFATNIMNRDPKLVLNAVVDVLNGKKIKNIPPKMDEFNGEWIQDPENNKRWIIRGKFQRVNTSTVRVTEIPPHFTYESYEKYLDDTLITKKKAIISYDNNSKNNIDYTIKFSRTDLAKYTDQDLIKLLKLESSETENFTALDEHGKIKFFESCEEIITYFTHFRLTYYQKRKEYLIDKLTREMMILSSKGRFIKAVIDKVIIVNNQSKETIIVGIEKLGLDKVDGNYDYLLRMPIYSLTKEMYAKLLEDFKTKKEEVATTKKLDIKELYLSELAELKKSL